MRHSRRVPLLALALTAAACDRGLTEPLPEADLAETSLTARQSASAQPAPMLARLFAQAVARVKADRGEAAATQLAAEHRRLALAARTARAAGDEATARARMQEADAAAARVVVRVFPDAPRRVLGLVAEQIPALERRIAAAAANGADVARARDGARLATRLHAAGSTELGNGRPAPALLHATRAADLLAALLRR